MRRGRYHFDAKKVQRYLQEGRGRGEFNKYLPWLKIQDVPSLGRSHRVWGLKTQRAHHFLSDGESKCFLMFESDSKVIDIREQFPLDTFQTFQAARRLGFRHPYNPDGSLYVMTIDFLVTYRDKYGTYTTPYTFKYSYDELSPREKELIEIAREFWRASGKELVVLSEKFFNQHLISNYDNVRAFFDISKLRFYTPELLQAVMTQFESVVQSTAFWRLTLTDVCKRLAHANSIEPSVVMSIVKHLVSRGLVQTDLSQPLPFEQFEICSFKTVLRAV